MVLSPGNNFPEQMGITKLPQHATVVWYDKLYLMKAWRRQNHNQLTVPVAVASSPTQSTPSNDAFLMAQMASIMAPWSPVPSDTKSGYLVVLHPLLYVEATFIVGPGWGGWNGEQV